MQELAPIVLFVYNRPEHTRQTLEALSRAELADVSTLIIFSDGSKTESDVEKVREVRRLIRSRAWCKEVDIRESETNKGLFASMVGGVTEVVNAYGRIIVLEDDLVVHPMFLRYMNHYLDVLEGDSEVSQISGYLFGNLDVILQQTFKIKLSTTWGWATWKSKWDEINFDRYYSIVEKIWLLFNKRKFNIYNSYNYYGIFYKNLAKDIESWGIQFWFHTFKNNYFVVYPPYSLVSNIGLDYSGEHPGFREIAYPIEKKGNLFPKLEHVQPRNDVLNIISKK